MELVQESDKELLSCGQNPGVHAFFSIEILLTPGLDNTRLFMSLTAGAGTRCMSLLSSSPSLVFSSLLFITFPGLEEEREVLE